MNWRKWFLALGCLAALAYFASLVYVAYAASATTLITATMAREDSGDYITSSTTVEYAWPSGTDWAEMRTVTISNGTGAFLYLKFWNSATTGTVSNTDFHLMLKTSETLVISRHNDYYDLLPIQTLGVYQRELTAGGTDPASTTLSIRGYK